MVATGSAIAVLVGSIVAGGAAHAAPATPTPTATASPTTTVAPRPVGTALAVDVTGSPVLTLPAADGLRDATRVRVRAGAAGTVDLIATRGSKTVLLAGAVRLAKAGTGWQRTVRVGIDPLRPGRWAVTARRSDARTVRATAAVRLAVGSGKPVHVAVRPAARVLYPWRDGLLDRADVTVAATDETGATIPVRGSVRVDAARKHVTRPVGSTGLTRLPVTGLPLGTAAVTVTVTGPAGKAVMRRTALTLAPTGVGTATLTRSSDTLQPVKDGFLDAATLSIGGTASAGSPAKVAGTLTIALGRKVVQRWAVPDGTPRAVSWDGRTAGVIVPGTYTATLTLQGPEGLPVSKSKTILVTKDHLPFTVQDLFAVNAGNQQGLAVHDGVFYVGFDNGDGTSRIEAYSGAGALLATLGPIDIGHAAELDYSTSTGLLYATNGGSAAGGTGNLTKVWAIRTDWSDPSTAIVATLDLSDLGYNGMVAVDDFDKRLLVFSGSAPDFRITPISLPGAPDGAGGTLPDSTRGPSTPIAITGTPQGIEVVGTQLWVYTSLKGRNHLARFDLSGVAAGTSADLMWSGEGEGSATGTWNSQPAFFVGAHDTNRIGVLVPVADE